MDCSLPGSSVHGIFQARVLEWVSISDIPNAGIEPGSPALQTDGLPSEPGRKPSIPLDHEIFAPCFMSLDMFQCFLVYSLWELE